MRQLTASEWDLIQKLGVTASLTGEGIGENTIQLEQNSSVRKHELHLLTPLRLRLWIGGEDYETARMRGRLHLEPASGEGTQTTSVCELVPTRDARASSLPLEVNVAVRTGKSGSCAVSFSAPYWLQNRSSIPLRLFDAGSYGSSLATSISSFARAKHVVEAEPNSPCEIPFSLGVDGSSVRLSVAPPPPTRQPAPATPTTVGSRAFSYLGFDASTREAPPQLSKAFSVVAVGSDGALEVGFGDGSVAEISVQISRAPTTRLASGAAPSTVVTLQDRFVLRNRSHVHLEWRQSQSVEIQQMPYGTPHRLPPDSRSEVPLRWASGTSQRLLSVRTLDGLYEWSPGFSPSTVGEAIIKLRPCAHFAAARDAGEGEKRPGVLYLRLTVSMDKVSVAHPHPPPLSGPSTPAIHPSHPLRPTTPPHSAARHQRPPSLSSRR